MISVDTNGMLGVLIGFLFMTDRLFTGSGVKATLVRIARYEEMTL